MRENCRHFADDIQTFFLNENVRIAMKISLKCLPKCPISSVSIVIIRGLPLIRWQVIMKWTHDVLPTHISVSRIQWVNSSLLKLSWLRHHKWQFKCHIYYFHESDEIYFWGFIYHQPVLVSDNGLATNIWQSWPMIFQLRQKFASQPCKNNISYRKQISMKYESRYGDFHLIKFISKCRLRNSGCFVSASTYHPSSLPPWRII